MAERIPYAYAPIRVTPRVERGERLNAGVVLYCRPRRFLAALTELNAPRLLALDPAIDLDAIRRHLTTIERIAAGNPVAGAIARLPQHERFGWLTAPASTVVHPGPVHGGICTDPETELAALFARLVGTNQKSEGKSQE
ncbi:MAG: DUF3037 domain-containing protein [Thermomicrobiales bacterium]|nr:DUF3037 domain-containing protein [Thermomicrobiales bacterium]